MKNLFRKLGGMFLGLAMLSGVFVELNPKTNFEEANAYSEVSGDSLDLTTKKISVNSYNSTNAYTDSKWSIKYGSNNSKGWEYFKMGGKKATLGTANPCELFMTSATSEIITKVTVSGPAGSLSKTGMSIIDWGLYVYSDSTLATIVDSVTGNNASITSSSWSADFIPSTGKTWPIGSFLKVSFNLENTTTTNGIVCIDQINCYKNEAQTISGDSGGVVGTGVQLTTSISSTNWSITSGSDIGSLSSTTGKTITVNAEKPGSITVKASNVGFDDASHTITFASAATESILVTGTNSLYIEDGSVSLTATPSNFSPSSYTWSSSDTSVATISGSSAVATLTALAKGTTNITASAQGSNGIVTSNTFTVTVKKFSISLSTNSVVMKASKTTSVTVTPIDQTGTVVITASSNDTNVANTSVNGSTISITSGSKGGLSTTITVTAKDNNGASGCHTAENKTISVEIEAGYIVGDKITSLPSQDIYVFLGNSAKTSWVGGTGTSLPETSNEDDAALFILSNTGTLRYFNEETETTGNYIYCTGGNTTVSLSSTSTSWDKGLADSDYPGLLQMTNTGGRILIFNGNIVKAYASSNKTPANAPYFVYAYAAVASTPSATLSGNSVSGMKGDSDTSLVLTLANFTATGCTISYKDNGASEFSSSSNVVSASCNYATGNNNVNVSFNGVGSTIVKLTITRTNGLAFEKTFTATVAAKPASMSIIHSDISAGHLEIQSGHNSKQVTFSGLDTDGQPYSITSSNVTGTVQSGSDYVTVDGSTIYGETEGVSVVRYTLNVLPSIYAEITVDVIDDYIDSVTKVTFNSSLTANQGAQIDSAKAAEIFNLHKGTLHFDKTETDIPYNQFMYSYTNNRSEAVSEFYLNQPISSVTSETIYVFHVYDTVFSTSFSISVTPQTIPVTSIAINNEDVTGNFNDGYEISLNRNSIFVIDASVLPTTTTQSKDIAISIDTQSAQGNASLEGTTLNVGTLVGNEIIITLTSAANNEIWTLLTVTVLRESQSITVNVPSSYELVTSATDLKSGDVLVIGVVDNGEKSTYHKTAKTISDKVLGTVASTFNEQDTKITSVGSETLELTLGGSEGEWTLSNNNKLLGATAAKKLAWDDGTKTWSISIDSTEYKATIQNGTSSYGRFLYNYNNGSDRFTTYASTTETSTTMVLPKLFKKTGGTTTKNIDDDLFNAVVSAESCFSCNSSGSIGFTSGKSWSDVQNCFSGISDANAEILRYGIGVAQYDQSGSPTGEGNEVQHFLSRYDFIISKYGTDTYTNFLSRSISNGSKLNILMPISEIGNNSWIIVIVSLTGLTAIGGYFFYKKRKENI